MALADDRIARDVGDRVSDQLARVGIFHRVFSRAKAEHSAKAKIASKGYCKDGKHLQDAIGVRVTTYFADDLNLANITLTRAYSDRFVSSTIDEPREDLFCPQRVNHVFRLSDNEASQVTLIRLRDGLVDSTFEIQLRTILSEGWHEVEHDHRYRCRNDWAEHPDLSRTLNGLIATLETCDWSMLQLFDELAMRHYRQRLWEPMLRNKYRLRFSELKLSQSIADVLAAEGTTARALFRSDRIKVLSQLATSRASLPITFDNIVFLVNHVEIKSAALSELVPTPVREELDRVNVA